MSEPTEPLHLEYRLFVHREHDDDMMIELAGAAGEDESAAFEEAQRVADEQGMTVAVLSAPIEPHMEAALEAGDEPAREWATVGGCEPSDSPRGDDLTSSPRTEP